MEQSDQDHVRVVQRVVALYCGLIEHEGYGDMRVEVRLLKRGQKEVIVHCGKQYRYVVDRPEADAAGNRRAAHEAFRGRLMKRLSSEQD
jgi:hypothetical protein